MPVYVVHDSPGGTRELYEAVADQLTGGRGLASLEDWPVEGILAHVAGPTEDGWRVIDVWESEQAFQRFGEVIGPVLQEVGFPGEAKMFQAHAFVS